MSDDATFQSPSQEAAPPFAVKGWVALGYVRGRYNPPSGSGDARQQDDFLGLYISKSDPGFGLLTFTGLGNYLAFHRCGESDATIAYAMIDAWLHYRIPFEQWQIYPTGQPEADIVEKMGASAGVRQGNEGLGRRALSSAPGNQAFPQKSATDVPDLIAIRQEIEDGQVTEHMIYRLLLGEERANKLREMKARLRRERASE